MICLWMLLYLRKYPLYFQSANMIRYDWYDIQNSHHHACYCWGFESQIGGIWKGKNKIARYHNIEKIRKLAKYQTITCLDEKQETQIIDCIWESRPLEQNINNWTKMQKCSDKRNKLELTPVDFSKFSNFPSTSATLTLRCSSNQALNWSK